MTVVEALKIPLIEKQRVPVAQIVRQLEATGKDKRLLESHIKEMKLVSALDENTIRIRPFNDDEHLFNVIYVFEVELKINDQHRELSELIHSVFPEPVLINYIYSDKNYLSAAEKRLNKKDQKKSIVINDFFVEVKKGFNLEMLDLSLLKVSNLRVYYEAIITLINKIKVNNLTGIYPNSNFDFNIILQKYGLLKQEIFELQIAYKNEKMLAKKIFIDNQLYEKELQLKKLLEEIGGK